MIKVAPLSSLVYATLEYREFLQAAPGADTSRPCTMSTFDNLGFNLRLSDIPASVGVAQMAKLDELLSERHQRALRYSRLLQGTADLVLPTEPAWGGHTYQSYVIRIADGGRRRRNRVMDELAAAGIQTRPGTHAVHRLGYYRNKYGLRDGDFPVAASCEDTTITLPIFPGMTDARQNKVVDRLRAAASSA